MASHVEVPQFSPSNRQTGLALWMERVLEECDHTGGLSPDSVHDLRVALRRCRSVADGVMAIDPDPEWKQMKKAGRTLFRSLGALRDVHVMQEWTERLGISTDPLTTTLREWLAFKEAELKAEAGKSLQAFDRKQWRRWATLLPRRATRLRKGSDIFQHLALERWTAAREFHRQALRNRSRVAFHNLRIGIKRFRYIVENFLPQQHEAWADDLKELQDLLGEVHDLDVLWTAVQQLADSGSDYSKSQWRIRIAAEREHRIKAYRSKMVGGNSLWQHWRKSLPAGKQIQAAALKRLKLWAAFFDPDLVHSHHVAKLAIQLFDGLATNFPLRAAAGASPNNGFTNNGFIRNDREILRLAALLHEIGRTAKQKKYEKATYRLIRRLQPPLGWSSGSWKTVAAVTRFHRRTLPARGRKTLRDLTPAERRTVNRLAGILRLAEALDTGHDQRIQRLEVGGRNGSILIFAQGYSPHDRMAENIAGARHLLEIVYRRPVMVNPMLVK